MKKILLALIALLIVPAVYAAVDVTYVFNQNNVNVSMYNCADATCSQVTPFSGSIIDGPAVTDSTITIRYPDSLATPFGYAGFFVSKGYRPLELHSTRHTNGQSGLAPAITVNAEFTKYPVVCRAVVSELNFVNELQPNIPLVVNTTARLDAVTASAFQLTDNDIGYLPSEFKQEYYGADTIVKMEVLQSGNVIHSQQQEFSAVKGNSLIADSAVPVQFTYLPSATGAFSVKVTAQVVDDQCASTEDQNAQGTFDVLASAPQGQFYTILNSLTVNNTHPRVGQPVLVSFSKLTNHADGSGVLTPIQTNVTYSVKNGASSVFNYITTLVANPDAVTPVTYSFVFTPTAAGVHTISVTGFSNSILPVTQPEIKDTETMQLNVIGSMSYKVVFQVSNAASGNSIANASVTMNGIGTNFTNANGTVVFPSVPEGDYVYTVSAFNFSSQSDNLKVKTDVVRAILLHPGANASASNTAPYMNLPSTFQLQQNTPRSFNFFPYVQDDQDRDSYLKLTVLGGNTSIAVDINSDGTVTFIPATGFTGTNTINFMLNDTQNATAVDSMTVTVVSGGSAAPVFSAIPTVTTAEDTAAVRVLNLRDYVFDADTSKDKLVFSIVSVLPNALATARIDDSQFLTVVPKADANGNGTISIAVTDGANTANATITLSVTPVNDAPVVISIPKIPNINESTNYTLNLSLVFRDPDGDPLIYNVTQPANVTFVPAPAVPGFVIVPAFNVNGTRVFNITAIDPFGLTAKATFTLFLNFVDDKPFFNAVVPNISTYEEVANNLDLTPYENDPENGPDANGNLLTWKMQLANQSNITPVTSLSTSLFDATITTITDMLTITPKANQSGSQDITLFLFDGSGKNVSQNITVTIVNVNDAPVFVNLSSKTSEAGMPFVFDVNATDSDPTNDTITFGLVNTTPALAGFSIDNATGMINFTPATNGVFTVNLQACDFALCSNGSFVLTISDTTAPTPDGQLVPLNPSIYAPGANYTFGINFTDNGNITNVTFQLGSITYTNVSQNGSFYQTTVSDLAAGNYTFKWTAKDGAGNVNMSNASTFTVLKANSNLVLTLNGTAGNITVPQGSVVSTVANLTNTTGTVSIYKNGALVTSGASPFSTNLSFPIQGTFNITSSFAGNQNYTAANTTLVVNVPDTVAPAFGTKSVLPVSPAMFTSSYNFSVNVTDNVAVTNVQLSVDNSTIFAASNVVNTSTWKTDLSSLSVGNHSMVWTASDAAGNVNSTAAFNYTVTPGIASVLLKLNGIYGNITAQVNDTVSIGASVANPEFGPVDLYINGTLAASNPTTPFTFNTSFASYGTVPITAVFPGDANVSAGNITRFLTITPIVSQANITPATGSLLNYSSFKMTLDTNAATTCKWSFTDVAQGSMNNSFTTTNGLNHSANVSVLGLGINPVFVACNNQGAANNSDLIYNAVNILDGSTLIAPNSISGTIMKSSSLNSTTLTNVTGTGNTFKNVTASANSVINTSILTNCTVTNATVISVTASDCTLADGIYDPSTLTGSNIGGFSSVVSSTVTFSNVTNSTISNANINNSVITRCTITNSSFSGATVTDCVIANMIISAGTITVPTPNGTFTYNATANGSANLSAVIPVPPVANFVPLSGSTTPGTNITWTSTTTDANIPGPLNDSLTFFWNFGDGNNATGANVSHAYNATGTYTITLTATDSFGFINTKTGSYTIAITPPFVPSIGGGNHGGGGGGGGGSGTARIALSDVPVSRVVYQGSALQFTKNGTLLPLSATLRRVNFAGNSSEWAINGLFYTVGKDQSRQFDLTRDQTMDLDLTITDVTRTSVTISVKAAGAKTIALPPLPLFNFTGVPKAPKVVQPKVPVVETVEETDETTVPVTAEVKESKLARFGHRLKEMFTFQLSPKSAAVKAGIVIAVVIIGLMAYALFVRWESF